MLSVIQELVTDGIKVIHKQSKKWMYQKMPGYTHTQRAMPTTVGTWLSSFSEALSDDFILLIAVQKIVDQNPLGSGAGFGTSVIPVDRAFTTKLLGFAKIQQNPIYCAHSRGKFENMVLQVLSNIMLDMGKCANDLVWFTSKEFNFFTLPPNYKTGSSMMPNKNNFDVLELLRGNMSIFLGYQYQVQEIIKNLFSGYNRDLQLTKEPYIKALKLFTETVQVFTLCIKLLEIHPEELDRACTDELYATEKALQLVQKGVPFRQAYQTVKQNL
jgi:argininosuccinate lyase